MDTALAKTVDRLAEGDGAPWRSAYNPNARLAGTRSEARLEEDLRKDYEDLRRPFSATPDVPYTDVWTFQTVGAYAGKHPCEKPMAMMEHIVRTSSKPGAVVVDPFAGSGQTLVAAYRNERRFLGCELSPEWCRRIEGRIDHERMPLFLEVSE